jgi:Ca-activated chloride channel homolog
VELSQFHFTHPLWLCLGLAIPVIWALYFFVCRKAAPHHQLTQFIDSHLLPFLLISNTRKHNTLWPRMILWTAVWSFLVLALAGPRWSFREVETFSKDQSLVILLDLSESMNATDVKPSRLVRAKQKIEDFLSLSKGVKIGLVAFAADPHMITPITDDKKNIHHLLPSLDTDLVHIQGSRLSPALEMAAAMFEAEPGKNKSIVVISDGGFEDGSAIATAKKLAGKGIVIHAMGVGTEQGAPMKDHQGNIIKKEGIPVVSKLEAEKFNEIANSGRGRYFEADYTDLDVAIILEDLEKKAETEKLLGNKDRIWEEHFYLVILLAVPMVLWWFRKGSLFAGLILLFTSLSPLEAEVIDYFKNTEQLGQEAFERENFEGAAQTFQDPYRKGIACYKAGKFSEAEEWFRQSNRPEVSCSTAYNLGNALALQNKFSEAITAYEEALAKSPDHTKAKENLELVKKMLEEQQPPPQEQNNNKDQQNQQKDSSNSNNQQDQQKDSSNTDQSSNSNNTEEQQDRKDEKKDQKNEDQGETEQQQDIKPSAEEKENNKDEQAPENQPQPQDSNEQEAKDSEHEGDANLWLNRLNNDPKTFMKNKFYIETKKNGTTEGINPW